VPNSIFFEFHLPNSATWFYFALMLAIALFFQFSRLLSLRNWDLLALFLFVPGFLLIQEANINAEATSPSANRERFIGYCWLLSASAYWLARCLYDLSLERRPTFRSNLTIPGLAWFSIALFFCLSAVAIQRPTDAWQSVGKQSAAISAVTEGATAVVSQGQDASDPVAMDEARAWVERVLAMLCHLAVVIGLLFIGIIHFRDAETGVAMAGLYLLIPYTAFHIAQLHHVLPAALTVWAIYCYRHPRVSGWLLGLAAGSTFFPMLLLPVWLHFYWRRGAWRFLSGFLSAGAVALAVTIAVLWSAGFFPSGMARVMHLSDWQPWQRPMTESLWQGLHWAYRLPVFIVFVAFVSMSFFWPAVRTMNHATAMSAAILIGIQFWFADRGGLYVLWYAPLLVIIAFRPTTMDLQPPTPYPGYSWSSRVAIAAWKRMMRKPSVQPPSLAA